VRIGELAQQAGISTKAIRYYEQIGILAPPARTPSGYRSYDQAALGRLGFVRAAQTVGLTLGEIRQIMAFRDDGQAPCAHVTDLLQRHAADLDRRIRELQQLRGDLRQLADGPPPLIPSTVRPSGSATSSPDSGLQPVKRYAVLELRRRWGRAAIPGLGPTGRPCG
jgi:MerR family transcriptional regulator, copper efflux regulator